MRTVVLVAAPIAAALLLVAVLVPRADGSPAAPVAGPSTESPPAPVPLAGTLPGLCEASAIVPYEGGYLVGDNEAEDRLYRYGPDFSPRGTVELAARMEDVEALAVDDGGRILVVASQSLSRSGKPRPDRERVLLLGTDRAVRPDLSACAACTSARALPPKEGGLSIEGAAWWKGSWWLGVRSPSASLLRLDGDPTQALRVADVVPLELGGLGVRDLYVHEGVLYILAGPLDGTSAPHALFRVDAPDAAPLRVSDGLPANAEGLVVENGAYVLVTDGDGAPGEPCREPSRFAVLPTR